MLETRTFLTSLKNLTSSPHFLSLPQISSEILEILLLDFISFRSIPKNIKNIFFVYDRLKKSSSNYLRFKEIISSEQKISHLPYYSFWGVEHHKNHEKEKQARLKVWENIRAESPHVVFCTLTALSQKTVIAEEATQKNLKIYSSQQLDFDSFIDQIQKLGYLPNFQISDVGQFAVRGSIVDIYSHTMQAPIRIEFFADQIESIRRFHIDSHISYETISEEYISPCAESLLNPDTKSEWKQLLYEHLLEKKVNHREISEIMDELSDRPWIPKLDILKPLIQPLQNLTNVIDKNNSLFIFIDPIEQCIANHNSILQEFVKDSQSEINQPLNLAPCFHFSDALSTCTQIKQSIVLENQHIPHASTYIKAWDTQVMEERERFIHKQINLGTPLIITGTSDRALEDIEGWLKFRHLPYDKKDLADYLFYQPWDAHKIIVSKGFDGSFYEPNSQIYVLAFKRKPEIKKSTQNKRKFPQASFQNLTFGDLVVHAQHGLCQYSGIKRMQIEGMEHDLIILTFKDDNILYLPVENLSLLSKYQGPNKTGKHSLDSLGSPSFLRKKQQAEAVIEEIADDLIATHAKRELSRISIYQEPAKEYYEFIDAFPYIETDDQIKALEDLENDFVANKAMDRIVIGDVGFGKTEIALRAALRTVLESYQVLILVPTTILSFQHTQTFKKRLDKTGAVVEQLNRFIPSKKQKEIINQFTLGQVDILIGTHKLLTTELSPKKLGLLIIDEEHRFGVKQKERLKSLKAGIHCLSMTATPIPRSLNMSILGLRDVSMLTTPPEGRMPIKSQWIRFDEKIISQAIHTELSRNGQIFFVHNNIYELQELSAKIHQIAPHAKIHVAHGQMSEADFEKILFSFIEHKFDILLCTTIIESGVDLPNVNTLIVNNAEFFGLSELHQLRGRVGRSNVQAFAFFITRPPDQLTDESYRRLDALIRYQRLGAGFDIAMQDMDIRGVGNLLGKEQSGHVTAIGLNLYLDLLQKKINQIRGKTDNYEINPEIKIKNQALIPVNYITDEKYRLSLYKQLFSSVHEDELETLRRNSLDQFGPLPQELENLFKISQIRLKLMTLYAKSLTQIADDKFKITFASLDEKRQMMLLQSQTLRFISLTTAFEIIIDYQGTQSNNFLLDALIDTLQSLVDML